MNIYSASKFCDMVGVPYSSLRYYERIGLLKPRKDENNNYREYTPYDAFLLNRFKTYRSIGFEIKESLELIKNLNPEKLLDSLDVQQMKIEKEIFFLKEKSKAIDKIRDNVLFAEQGEENFKIDYINDKLFLPASEGNDFSAATFNVFSKWVELLPITSYCKRIKEEDLLNNEEVTCDYGISIDVENINLLNDGLLKDAELIKGGKCIAFFSTKFAYPFTCKETYNRLFKFINDNNYVIKGGMYMEGVKLNKNSGGNIVKIIVE